MDDNYNTNKKLIRHLDNELSESEAQALKLEINDNSILKQEMDNLILTQATIKNYGLTQKVRKIHLSMMEEMPNEKLPSKPVVRNIPKTILSIAATILLLAGLFMLYEYVSLSPKNLFEEKYSQYQTGTMRGSGAASPILLNYNNKKYDSVIAEYGRITNPAPIEQFLAAQSYLNVNSYEKAIELFTTTIQKNKSSKTADLNDEASYYLALSYLRNNQPEKALPILEEIYNDKSQLYHNKVNRLFLIKVKLLSLKN